MYFNTYDFCVTDGNNYIEACRPHAEAIRAVLPDAKVAAAVSSAVYTKDDFLGEGSTSDQKLYAWNRELVTDQDWFDTVTVHMYSSLGKDVDSETTPFETMYNSAISHADNRTSDVIDNLQNQFPEKQLWVTEWHVGGFSEFRNLILLDTWLGDLYATQVLLKFMTEPSVKLTSLHSLTKTIFISTKSGAGSIAENYLDDDLKTVPRNGMPPEVFGPIVSK